MFKQSTAKRIARILILAGICICTSLSAQISYKEKFPYREYKSVVLRMKKSGEYVLNANIVKQLTAILNTTANFQRGEPDMPNIDGKVEFMAPNGYVVGSFTFDYYYGALYFTPANKVAKDGLLTSKANRKFFAIIKQVTKGRF